MFCDVRFQLLFLVSRFFFFFLFFFLLILFQIGQFVGRLTPTVIEIRHVGGFGNVVFLHPVARDRPVTAAIQTFPRRMCTGTGRPFREQATAGGVIVHRCLHDAHRTPEVVGRGRRLWRHAVVHRVVGRSGGREIVAAVRHVHVVSSHVFVGIAVDVVITGLIHILTTRDRIGTRPLTEHVYSGRRGGHGHGAMVVVGVHARHHCSGGRCRRDTSRGSAAIDWTWCHQ